MRIRPSLRLVLLGLLALVLAVGAAGCGREDDDDANAAASSGSDTGASEELSGSVEADGSSTVGPLTTAAAEGFREEQPGVNVTVGISGTGGGFERFCAGETDISDASRPIDEEEEAPLCADAGIEYTELKVATDALTVVVNPENDWIDCITTEQLAAIWGPGLQDQELAGRPRRRLPGPAARAGGRRHGLRHVRLLHRRHQRRGGREPLRLHRQRGRQRDRPGGRGRQGRHGLLRLHVLRGEPGSAQGPRDRQRRRVRRAEPGDSAGRLLRTALPPALRLRQERVARRGPRSWASSATTSRTSPRSRRRRSSSS